MSYSAKPPTESQIVELLSRPCIKASEALSLTSTTHPGKFLEIDTDRWSIREDVRNFSKIATRGEIRVMLEHKEDLEIRFPVTPLAFYRWAYISGNPLRLWEKVIEVFVRQAPNHIFELSRSDLTKLCPARAGWKIDVRKAIAELIEQATIPTRENILESLTKRTSDSVVKVSQGKPVILWRTSKGQKKTITGRSVVDPIDDYLRNIRDAAIKLHRGETLVEVRRM